MTSCDGATCCEHDITRGVTRDGIQHSICLACGLEVDADDMPVMDSVITPAVIAVPVLGTPCGSDIPRLDMDDIAHRWGWL